jgi:hypothetical protein
MAPADLQPSGEPGPRSGRRRLSALLVEARSFLRNLAGRFLRDLCLERAAALSFTTVLSLVPAAAISLAFLSALPQTAALRSKSRSADSLSSTQCGRDGGARFSDLYWKSGQSKHAWLRRAGDHRDDAARDREQCLRRDLASQPSAPATDPIAGLLGNFDARAGADRRRAVDQRPAAGDGRTLWRNRLHLVYRLDYADRAVRAGGGRLHLLYLVVPNRRASWRDALAGGIVGALLFEGAKHGLAFYIVWFPTYDAIYGALAAIPVFLGWVYLCWIATLIGAEVAATLPEWRLRKPADMAG